VDNTTHFGLKDKKEKDTGEKHLRNDSFLTKVVCYKVEKTAKKGGFSIYPQSSHNAVFEFVQ
jgi:hypothetical protein